MNREIKFRAWNKINKQMYTGLPYNNAKGNDDFQQVIKHPQVYEVMQSTGLKDINDVEIYEGDILYGGIEYYMQYGNVLVGIGECFGNEEIKDEDNMVYGVYIEVDNEKVGISQNNAYQFEIVGNIHESKDLLSPYIVEVQE